MASPLAQLGAFLTPPPVVLTPDYDGLEFKWKMFAFRPALFKNELYLLSAVLFYAIFHFVGRKINEKRANGWFDAHLIYFATQFTKPVQPGGLTQDGNSDFFGFSTGRRGIKSLHTTLTLRPRHDFFQWVYQLVWGLVQLDYKVADEVELDFTLKDGTAVPECVWAVVAKEELRGIKNNRWDLNLTKTSDHTSLPPTLSVMAEFADITDCLFKTHGPLSLPAVLSNPAIQPYFRSLSITDQPRTRPLFPIPSSERSKHVILSLTLPPSSESSLTLSLVTAVFQLIDVISAEGGWGIGKVPTMGKSGVGLNSSLRPETRTKLKKAREDIEKQLKEESEREKKEEAAEEKAAAKKKAEEERLSKLSASEQKKVLEREKKRAMRKTQGKVKTR
ncbi:hypothetical protein QCA50_000461 [Cerrena zonata]|uniref:DUF1682-domain-containing protein n=1 Tax=Cerrena zonata TaxID=2478898 RepID=A0AAW0GXZ6_9APHY